jgi:peptide/nickel transport system ATP-binding protein
MKINSENALVSIKGLSVSYPTYRGVIHAVRDVSIDINSSEIMGLIGETGCGKSTLGLAIARLVPGKIENGEIFFEGEDLLKKNKGDMRTIRGDKISMIFQDPTASLNPVMRVGDQICESIMFARNLGKLQAMEEAVNLLSTVRIADARKVARQYPHELSGGMRQRVMIAIAFSAKSKLLIADEPTSSLDVTIQAEILDLIRVLKKKGMSVLMITHDLGVIAQISDRVVVMYAGKVVEIGSVVNILKASMHPYVKGLLGSLDLNRKNRLEVIPGDVPDLTEVPRGCPFYPRCPLRRDICRKKAPELREVESGHLLACHL